MDHDYWRRSNRAMAVWALLHFPVLLLAIVMDPKQLGTGMSALFMAMILGGGVAFYYGIYCYFRANARPSWVYALVTAGLIVVSLYWRT